MQVQIPTNCPSCSSVLERVKDQLFCRNKNCGSTQIKKVVNFAKVMKIKGLGEKTIEKLEIVTIPEIYALTLENVESVIGNKLAFKLLDEINKSKETTVAKFIAACSIPLVGNTVASKLESIIDIANLTTDKCKSLGIGEKASNNITEWVKEEYIGYLDALPIKFVTAEIETKNNITVCITGKIPGHTKDSLKKYLKNYNVSVLDTVSARLKYLVCNEKKGSAKEKKAESLNIKIVTLEELMKEINNDN